MNAGNVGRINDLSRQIESIEAEERKEAHFIFSNEIRRRVSAQVIERVSRTFKEIFDALHHAQEKPRMELVEESLQGQIDQIMREFLESVRQMLAEGLTERQGQTAILIPGIDLQDMARGLSTPTPVYPGTQRYFRELCEHCSIEVENTCAASLQTLRALGSRIRVLSLYELRKLADRLHTDHEAANIQLYQNTLHQARLLHLHCMERDRLVAELQSYRAPQATNIVDACTLEDTGFIQRDVDARGIRTLSRETFGDEGRTPLTWAASQNKFLSVRALVEQGADVSFADKTGDRPLHRAAKVGNMDMFYLFCTQGASVNARGEFERTPLHYAAYNGKVEFTLALLGRGADPNAYTNNADGRKTPLHDAVRQDKEQSVAVLVTARNKPNPHLADIAGKTPVHDAIEKGLDGILKLLFEHSGWQFSNDPASPCHISSLLKINPEKNKQEIFKILLGYASGLYLIEKVKREDQFRQQLFDTISLTRLAKPCRALAAKIIFILKEAEIWQQENLFISGFDLPKLYRFEEEERESLESASLSDIDRENPQLLELLGIELGQKQELFQRALNTLVIMEPIDKKARMQELVQDKQRRNQFFEWLEKCRQGIFSIQVAKEAVSLLAAAKIPLNSWDFNGTDISGANMQKALLFGARFEDANTRGVNFSGAILSEAQMKRTKMQQAVFGQLVYSLGSLVNAVVSSSRGNYFFAGCQDGSVRIWNVKRGVEAPAIMLNNGGVASLLLIDDTKLVIGGNDRSLRVWDLKQGRLLHERTNLPRRPTQLAYLKKENQLLSAGEESTLYLWSLDQNFASTKLQGHPHAVCNIAVAQTAERSIIFSEAADQILYKWNVATKRAEQISPAYLASHMRSLTVIPQSTKAAWTINNRSVVFFDVNTHQNDFIPINDNLDEEAPALNIAFSQDGKWLAATTRRGISLIDWQRKTSVHHIPSLAVRVEGLHFLSETKLLVRCADKTVRVLNLPFQKEITELPKTIYMGWHQASSTLFAKFPASSPEAWHRDSGAPQDMSLFKQADAFLQSSTGDLFALRKEPGRLLVYNHQGTELSSFNGDFKTETAVYLGEGRIAVTDGEAQVHILNFTTRTQERTFRPGPIISALIPMGIGQLAIGCSDHSWRVLNYLEGHQVQEKKVHQGHVTALLYHNDQLVSGSQDKNIVIHKEDATLLLKGHEHTVTSLAHLEGKILISSSFDKTVRFWDMKDGRPLLTLPHPVPLASLKLRGNYGLYIADTEGGIWYWKLNNLKPELVWANQPEFISAGVDTQEMQDLSAGNKAFLVEHGARP